MIGSFTLVSWGTLGLFWDTREHNKGHFEVQAWISTDFWCYLACLVPLLWRLGGPWDDPGTMLGRSRDIGGHKEGPCDVFAYFWTKKEDLFISISRLLFLMIFGFDFGCLGLQKQAFGKGGIAKTNFRRNWISYDSRVHFS